MSETLQPGLVRVKSGIHKMDVAVVGRSVEEVKNRLSGVCNIDPEALIRVNGASQNAAYKLKDQDVLEFVTQDGEKAMASNQPVSNEQATLAIAMGDMEQRLNTNLQAGLRQISAQLKQQTASAPQRQRPARSPRAKYGALLLVAIGSMCAWGGLRQFKEMEFSSNFNKYYEAARKTNDKERAQKYLARAEQWLVSKNMTEGRTDVFLDGGPESDVQEWYTDTKQAIQKGTELPAPPSGMFQTISLYPHNQQFFLWFLGNCAALIVAVIGIFLGGSRRVATEEE
jgi:hypothetical protein